MEPSETTAPGRRTSSALSACEQCQGVFPVMDMRAHERRMYCRACHRKAGGVDPVLGPPAPLPVAGGGEAAQAPHVSPVAPDAEAQLFAEYADLRQRLERDPDDLDSQRRAGELTSRLGLLLECAEHYRACVRLAPGDDQLVMRLENVELTLRRNGELAPSGPDPAEARIPAEARPFWTEPRSVLAYPFEGRGPSLMIVAGLFFGGLHVIASVNVIGFVIVACLAGYVGAYLFEIINSTAAGQKQPPDFPEPASVLESYVYPLLSILSCLTISYAPCVLAAWLVVRDIAPVWLAAPLFLSGAVFGTFVFPMTLIVKALFQDIAQVVKPGLVFGSIARILPDYMAGFVATCAIWIAYAVASTAVFFALTITLGRPTPDALFEMDAARLVAWIFHTVVTWPLLLYCVLLQGHLLGRLYRQGLRRLAWFVPPTEDTRRAARMSVGLGVAGAAAALLLSGTLWLGYMVLERTVGNPAGLSLMQSAPIGPGAELTYYWEHTDGARGLTVYSFEAVGEEEARLIATTELVGDVNAGISRQEIGVFERGSGEMTSISRAWVPSGVPLQAVGEHVSLYGPRSAHKGGSYINGWPVRGVARHRDTWDAYKVHDPDSTSTLFFDSATGIYVGRRLVGVGFVLDEWLVRSRGIEGLTDGPEPRAQFELLDQR